MNLTERQRDCLQRFVDEGGWIAEARFTVPERRNVSRWFAKGWFKFERRATRIADDQPGVSITDAGRLALRAAAAPDTNEEG